MKKQDNQKKIRSNMSNTYVSPNEMELMEEVIELSLNCLSRNGTFYLTDRVFALAVDLQTQEPYSGSSYSCHLTLFGDDYLHKVGPSLSRLGFVRLENSKFGPEFKATFCLDALSKALFSIMTVSIERCGREITSFELNSLARSRRALDMEVYKFIDGEEEGAVE